MNIKPYGVSVNVKATQEEIEDLSHYMTGILAHSQVEREMKTNKTLLSLAKAAEDFAKINPLPIITMPKIEPLGLSVPLTFDIETRSPLDDKLDALRYSMAQSMSVQVDNFLIQSLNAERKSLNKKHVNELKTKAILNSLGD